MKQTLCWECKRACGGCSWSRDFKPVRGWKAEKTKIARFKDANADSYIVKECPLFVQDRKE